MLILATLMLLILLTGLFDSFDTAKQDLVLLLSVTGIAARITWLLLLQLLSLGCAILVLLLRVHYSWVDPS